MDNNQNNKIFCGSGKSFGQYGSVSISICVDDIPKEYIKQHTNGKRYINLNVNPKRQIDQYGKTHSVEVDTWQPQQNGNQQTANFNQQQQNNGFGQPQETAQQYAQPQQNDGFGGFPDNSDLPF